MRPHTWPVARWLLALPAIVCATSGRGQGAEDTAPAARVQLRVETAVFDGTDEDEEPVARSLTLFQDGVVWDFLEPVAATPMPIVAEEIVLHDPARGRVVVIDPTRRVRTEISAARLSRVRTSLHVWAQGSDDALLQWSASPECTPHVPPDGGQLELDGPGARYRVATSPAPSAAAAEQYRSFADAAVILRALLHPGGLPPFPRLAINRELAAAGLLPDTVSLELSGGSLRQSRVLRSEHRCAPRLTDADLDRIETASAAMAVADVLDLDEYMQRDAAVAAANAAR